MENKVINVQMDEETFKKFQSGGGGSTPTEPSNMKYYDCRPAIYQGKYFDYTMLPNIDFIKLSYNEKYYVCSGVHASYAECEPIMICVDTSKDFAKDFNVSDYVEITKEEFYASTEVLNFMLTATEEEAQYLFDKMYSLWDRFSEFAIEEPCDGSFIVKKCVVWFKPQYEISEYFIRGLSGLYGCLEKTNSPFNMVLASSPEGGWGFESIEGVKIETLYFSDIDGENTHQGVSRVLLEDGSYRYGFTLLW